MSNSTRNCANWQPKKESSDMIVKVKGGWKVLSEKRKPLSKVLKSRKAAEKRLRQVEWFKHHPKK